MNVDTACKDGDIDMRCHRLAIKIHTAWLDGMKMKVAIHCTRATTKTAKGLFVVKIGNVVAMAVGLPNLDECIAYPLAIAIVDMTDQFDMLTFSVFFRQVLPNLI